MKHLYLRIEKALKDFPPYLKVCGIWIVDPLEFEEGEG